MAGLNTSLLMTTFYLLVFQPRWSCVATETITDISSMHQLTAKITQCQTSLIRREFVIIVPDNFKSNFEHDIFRESLSLSSCSAPNLPTDRTLLDVVLFCGMDTNLKILNSLGATSRRDYRWRVWTRASPKLLRTMLENPLRSFGVDSKLIFMFPRGSELLFQEAYTLDGNLRIRPVDSPCDWGEVRRANLEGTTLNVTATYHPNYAYDLNITSGNGKVELLPSFGVATLRAHEYALNFKSAVNMTSNWGFFNETTKRWGGMVGAILDDSAQFAITSATGLPQRRQVVDFMLPTASWGLRVFFKKPQNSVALLEPFSKILWFTILGWIGVTTVIPLIFRALLHSRAENVLQNEDSSGSPESWSAGDSLFWAIGSFCSQGCPSIPRPTCYKMLVFTSQLAGMVINIAYSGVLISFLSVGDQNPIKCFDELLKSSYTLVMDGNPLLHNMLRKSFTMAYPQLNRSWKNDSDVIVEISDVREEIMEGHFGFATEDSAAYFILHRDFGTYDACSIGNVAVPSGIHNMASMIPKDWPFKRIFNSQIMKYKEVGLENLWRKRYWPKKVSCDETPSFEGVDRTKVILAFSVLIAGKASGLLILLVELVVFQFKNLPK